MAPVLLSRPSCLQSSSLPLFTCTKTNTTTNNTSNRLSFGLKSRFSGLKWKLDNYNKRVLVVSSSAVAAENEHQAEGATIDLKLPRRSLLVHFTCDACGVRSQRLINRLAYEKGLVYVQCSGCSQYHKLVDNLDLVVEYDLREEINTSSDTDQT